MCVYSLRFDALAYLTASHEQRPDAQTDIQRAKPATKREMTQFHSDEYVDFLSRINPSNMNSYIKEQHKCLSSTHIWL